jgi:TRAP-type C4-dicarboxylate transport system permease small subunit
MKILRWLDQYFEEVILVFLSAIMVVVTFLQVFMRYVMQSSLGWSEELARYCMIWLIYIGISYGVKKQRHIKVDALLLLFKHKGKIIFNIISNLSFLVFAIFIIIYGSDMALKLWEWGQTSPALHIPVGLVYLATPIGMGLTAIRIIQQLIIEIEDLLGYAIFEVGTEKDRLLEEEEPILHMEEKKEKK